MNAALAYCDARGRIYFDEHTAPLADGGIVREPRLDELIPVPKASVPMLLPQRRPFGTRGLKRRRHALGVALPAGYTRLLLPAYEAALNASPLPLFGYTFACAVGDRLHVAAVRTDEHEDWRPRSFAPGELERLCEIRIAADPANRTLRQLARCAVEYACFTAQNVFLERGEAALPVSPRCNARCAGCISELEDGGVSSPQQRISYETSARELARVAVHHLERVDDGIVSFGQGCEGEPLLRSSTIARAIETIRGTRRNGTINLNTNGSLAKPLTRCIDAGLDAVRVSLNSFRDRVYEAYYRPRGYALADVLESVRRAVRRGVRVSVNLLTHPGVTDDEKELEAMLSFLRNVPVSMVQTRTLNIDPAWYFSVVGRPRAAVGMKDALDELRKAGVRVGNFTHTH